MRTIFFLSLLLLTLSRTFIWQIFRHLAPSDLLHLIRTNKTFRSLLLSRSATTVWKSSRKSLPGPPVPDPPEIFSCEPKWAELLFGGATCSVRFLSFSAVIADINNFYAQECFSPGIRIVDFGLLRRMCNSCKKARCVHVVFLASL